MSSKLKYQGGATKQICMFWAGKERKKFSKLMWADKIKIEFQNQVIDFDVISFSGKKDFEEQILSLYSFLFYIGTPQKWILYSDGSHEEKEKKYLLEKFPFLQIKNWDSNSTLAHDDYLERYLKVSHLSKKLRAIAGHNYQRQTIYLDSDIVLYRNASVYFNSTLLQNHFWYIPETNWGSFREHKINEIQEMYALNSGLLILNKNFNFGYIFDYLQSLDSSFEYFTEQNSFNYSFKKQNANILDPRQFVIGLGDQFDFAMAFNTEEIAARHYVTPVRHKIWQKGWKWHFKK